LHLVEVIRERRFFGVKGCDFEPPEVKINGERAVAGEFNEARDFRKNVGWKDIRR
jgi:hypothetical protein